MRTTFRRARRRGSILPMVALCAVALFGFVALAIDLGLIMVARTQCQRAADAAAMGGARTINGIPPDYGADDLEANAKNAAARNDVLGRKIDKSKVTVEAGSYVYVYNAADPTQEKFEARFPYDPDGADPLGAARATVEYSGDPAFARVFGIMTLDAKATATAIHRPRDVAIILDYSGSMRFDSLFGIPYNGARTMSNNPESWYPRWGHYDTVNSGGTPSSVVLRNSNTFTTLGGHTYGSANVTVETAAGPPIVDDFYLDLGSAIKAFAPASASDPTLYETTPGGDNCWRRNNNDSGQPYAETAAQVLNTPAGDTANRTKDTTWETNGYGSGFAGYTRGPRYWGKTFWVWPPDPRADKDWRRRFFFKNDGVTPVDDNALLWVTSNGSNNNSDRGRWRTPRYGGTDYYRVNYAEILRWLDTDPKPLPSRLRAGRILYYDALPDYNDSNLNQRWWTTYPLTDPNERFWKEYIDYVLGLWQTGANTWYVPSTSNPNIVRFTGYGDDFIWGTRRVTAKSSIDATVSDPASRAYIDYRDNPQRPVQHLWFGPMTLVDFLGNYNLGNTSLSLGFSASNPPPYYGQYWWWPGTCHEATLWSCKVGVRAALQDIEKNHPNDFVSVMMFSAPEQANGGRFNRVRAPLSRQYNRMINSLFYPPSTLDANGAPTGEARLYAADPTDPTKNLASATLEAPRGMGGTGALTGFVLAFNQFSSNPDLRDYAPLPAPPGEAGGFGRKGAQKMVIFETDGVANVRFDTDAHFEPGGDAYMGYYKVRLPGEYPQNIQTYDVTTDPTGHDRLLGVVDRIVSDKNSGLRGYSTGNKPVLAHCIAFGSLFDATSTDPNKQPALDLLQNIQFKGSTQASPSTPLPDDKVVPGTLSPADRANKLRNAFYKIMQSGVQVSLID